MICYIKWPRKHKERPKSHFNKKIQSYDKKLDAEVLSNNTHDNNNSNTVEMDTMKTTSPFIINNPHLDLETSISQSGKG